MGLWQRFATIFKAKANKALDRAEDPRETLDLSYQQQVENLTKVRRALADVATARKRLELQAEQLKSQGDKLSEQAKTALQQNNEPLAREALARREAVAAQLKDLEVQHASVDDQQQKLTDTASKLQAEVEAFRTRKETLKATYTAAEATSKINESMAGIGSSMSDAGAALSRAQDKIDEMTARSGALDELLSSGALTDLTGSRDDIQRELDKSASKGNVDAALQQMKAELATGDSPGALGAGESTGETK
jgi:phage shock protein A